MDDAEEFHGLASALSTLGVSDEEQEGLWRLLSALLHLGNIRFLDDEGGHESAGHGPQLLRLESPLVEVEEVAKMAGLPADRLTSSLRKKVRRGFWKRFRVPGIFKVTWKLEPGLDAIMVAVPGWGGLGDLVFLYGLGRRLCWLFFSSVFFVPPRVGNSMVQARNAATCVSRVDLFSVA